jgi:tRNA1Val (adenine37-N6)-methyltransferase
MQPLQEINIENDSFLNELSAEKQANKVSKPFQFKQFSIEQDQTTMKVGTDGVLLGAWANVQQAKRILDIGTGTGVIALMLAQRTATEGGQIDAVEIDEAAFQQATNNAQKSPFSAQVRVFHDSIQTFAQRRYTTTPNIKYDLIVSNPPFFTGGTFSSDENKNRVRHTVKLPHSDLLNATRQLLHKEGRFCVILPLIEGLRFIEIARTYGFHCTQKVEVLPKASKPIGRLLLQFEFMYKSLIINMLTIRGEGENDFTAEYKTLTKDFYTVF